LNATGNDSFLKLPSIKS